MNTPEASPLTEATPASLQELFDLDPLKLTDNDIDRVVQELRRLREGWQLKEKKAKPTKVASLDLKDLGL